MTKLSFNYKNIKFKNPFILASSPITRNTEMIARGFEAGWAGAVTKTICLQNQSIKNASPRIKAYKDGQNFIGMQNIELISDISLEQWKLDILNLKEKYPDNVLIASISAGAFDFNEWQFLASEVEQAGADIIELNLSCPNGLPERNMGSYCSTLPDVCFEIIKHVKEASSIPVWAKLSPNSNDISYLAKRCLDAKADGIVAINTLKAFSGINIETLEPKLSVNGKSCYGGFSGKLIKPIALKAVSEIAIDNNCYISGSGGISSWQDAIEFILCGASNIQLCTEVMYNDYNIIKKLLVGMEDYMERHNYSDISSIQGKALCKIVSNESLDKKSKSTAIININECIKCTKCYKACKDSGFQAITCSDGIPVINTEKCDGCGLCLEVCPNSCIKMESKVSISALN